VFPIIQFPEMLPAPVSKVNRIVEPINKKAAIKDYTESNKNKFLGTVIDIYV
jgi:hypothetical protein